MNALVKLAEKILDKSGLSYTLQVIEVINDHDAVKGIRNCRIGEELYFFHEAVNAIKKATREDRMREQCELLKRHIEQEFIGEEEK